MVILKLYNLNLSIETVKFVKGNHDQLVMSAEY
jgi:UDP-2,3-diacylglucosamine pyrophosphatase LpxH